MTFFTKKIFLLFFIFLNFFNVANSEIVKKIIIEGNERISKETINIFSSVSINGSTLLDFE